MKKLCIRLGIIVLALVMILPVTLVSCTKDKDGGNDSGTSAASETTGSGNKHDPSGAETAIIDAFRKLSDATYLESETTVSTKISGGPLFSGTDSSTFVLQLRNDPSSGAFYIKNTLSEDEYFESYSAGGKEFFSKSVYGSYDYETFDEITETDIVHGASNVDFTLKTVMKSLSFDVNEASICFISPSFYEELAAMAVRNGAAKITVSAEGTLYEVPLSYEELVKLIDETDEGTDEFEIEAAASFRITKEGTVDNVSLSYKIKAMGIKSTLEINSAYSNVNKESGVPAPDWLEEATGLEISDYYDFSDTNVINYTFYDDGEVYLNDIRYFDDTLPDVLNVPALVDGREVTGVSWLTFEGAVTPGGTVILPASVDCSDFWDYGLSCTFYTESERPDDCYANEIYFSGEWEINDGKVTPTRGEIKDPSAPIIATDNYYGFKWKHTLADYDAFTASNPGWMSSDYNDGAWESDTADKYDEVNTWAADDGSAVFLRSGFRLSAGDVENIQNCVYSLLYNVGVTGERMLVYINGELVIELEADEKTGDIDGSMYLYSGYTGYAYKGIIGGYLKEGYNTVAIAVLPFEGSVYVSGYGFELFCNTDFEPDYERDEYLIYIDPGHGFVDPGASTPYIGNYYERDITLMVAEEVVSQLCDLGYTALLTHDGDTLPDSPVHDAMEERFHINERSSLANANGVDLFVSLHCDSFGDESVSGTRLYYCNDYAYASGAADLANKLETAIGKALPNAKAIRQISYPTYDAYHVNAYVNAPSVLVEMGYISNPDDAANAMKPEWRTKMTEGIVNGIVAYVTANA